MNKPRHNQRTFARHRQAEARKSYRVRLNRYPKTKQEGVRLTVESLEAFFIKVMAHQHAGDPVAIKPSIVVSPA